MRSPVTTTAIALAILIVILAGQARAEQPLTVDQVVALALEANPQVRAARARWYSASHTIQQNYAPVDPILSYGNFDSPTDGFDHASSHSLQVGQALQFPGKALLQADNAKRTASIARLTYDASLRDVRAQAQTAFYQILLDSALADVTATNVASLRRVLEVTEVAYSTSSVTQSDFIGAEFSLAQAQQQERQFRTAEANDETTLNQLLNRSPSQPLHLDHRLEFGALETRVDTLIEQASALRQEILEAALTERNTETALTLAKLEYAPDYTVTYIFNHYLLPSAAPAPSITQTHGFSISFNAPVFFWLKQNEDIKRATYDMEAAREDLSSIRNQTAAQVTTLYRQAQLSYNTAVLYRDSLIPLARQWFEVALVGYQGGKIDFITLATTLQQSNDTRVAYLQAANQFLAQRIALEQAIGGPIPK
jgi:cobalt-zinc-cadmium efflux system outer membrane protein